MKGIETDVTLDQVYVALDTKTRVKLTAGEKEERSRSWEDDRALSAVEAATEHHRLALLGDPGSGKSTFTRQLCAWLGAACLGEQDCPAGWQAGTAPLFMTLRDLSARLAPLKLDGLSGDKVHQCLLDAVWEQWVSDIESMKTAGAEDVLRHILSEGRVLLVFDGMDEIPEALRPRVRRAVGAVLKEYPKVDRAIVTCRIRSYDGPAVLAGFHAETLAPFDEEKISQFIQGWYTAQVHLGRMTGEEANARAEDLNSAALAADLRELATNPMLLTSMAIIHQRDVGLPRERVRLYSLAVQVLLSRWQKAKGIAASGTLEKLLGDDLKLRDVLERLAYMVHEAQAGGAAGELTRMEILSLLEQPKYLGEVGLASEFLDYVDQRAGLLVGLGGAEGGEKPSVYVFPHRTFQEYLAGCQMVKGRSASREYWQRVREGDYWYLAGQLGAEELLYNRRNPEAALDLAYSLCGTEPPESVDEWRALVWSGQMAATLGKDEIAGDEDRPDGGLAYLERLTPRLVQALEAEPLKPVERAGAGVALGKLGDPRPEVMAVEGMHFCHVPAGPFWMGSDDDPDAYDDEKLAHSLDIPYDYWMARYPVTNAQYRPFVEDPKGYRNDRWWTKDGLAWREDRTGPRDYGEPFNLSNHPVVGITWYEALAYTRWLTEALCAAGALPDGCRVRLPSEAEWEKAARGGLETPVEPAYGPASATNAGARTTNPLPKRRYPWGDEADPGLANYGESGIDAASAVGCFYKGRSPYGCEEMSGNVWEWTRSLGGKESEDEDAAWNVPRVLRGGSFNYLAALVRCAGRGRYPPDYFNPDLGVRVVVVPTAL